MNIANLPISLKEKGRQSLLDYKRSVLKREWQRHSQHKIAVLMGKRLGFRQVKGLRRSGSPIGQVVASLPKCVNGSGA
jgi:hypothetical protein